MSNLSDDSQESLSRIAVWIVVVLVVIAGVYLTFKTGKLSRSESAVEQTLKVTVQPEIVVQTDTSWPMFRGGQGLLGRARDILPNSMALAWKFKTHGEVKSSPAIDGGLVFIGSYDGNVYAIDLLSGRKVWAYQTGDVVESAPCAVEGSVFVGSADGFLYALDAKTGEFRWKYETGGQILGAANWTQSPDGQRVWILVGSYDNKLHCVDSMSGKLVWAYETESYINGSPAVGDGKAVFGGCDAMIHVVSLADGMKVAQIDSGSYIAASPAFTEGQVYLGNYDNVYVRADIASGEIVWRYSGTDAPFFSSPAVGEQVLIFGGRDNHVHCVRRHDGKAVWTFRTLGEVDSSPVICADKVVVGSEDGRLYMIRLADGKEIWSYEIGQAVTSSPAVAGGMIVVGSDDGYVYAFRTGK